MPTNDLQDPGFSLKCHICKKSALEDVETFLEHMRDTHSSVKLSPPFSCGKRHCNAKPQSIETLIYHIQKEHSDGQKAYYCTYCYDSDSDEEEPPTFLRKQDYIKHCTQTHPELTRRTRKRRARSLSPDSSDTQPLAKRRRTIDNSLLQESRRERLTRKKEECKREWEEKKSQTDAVMRQLHELFEPFQMNTRPVTGEDFHRFQQLLMRFTDEMDSLAACARSFENRLKEEELGDLLNAYSLKELNGEEEQLMQTTQEIVQREQEIKNMLAQYEFDEEEIEAFEQRLIASVKAVQLSFDVMRRFPFPNESVPKLSDFSPEMCKKVFVDFANVQYGMHRIFQTTFQCLQEFQAKKGNALAIVNANKRKLAELNKSKANHQRQQRDFDLKKTMFSFREKINLEHRSYDHVGIKIFENKDYLWKNFEDRFEEWKYADLNVWLAHQNNEKFKEYASRGDRPLDDLVFAEDFSISSLLDERNVTSYKDRGELRAALERLRKHKQMWPLKMESETNETSMTIDSEGGC